MSIKGYARDTSKVAVELQNKSNVTLFKGDAFDEEAVRGFVKGADVVICCYLGDDRVMIEGQKILIDASIEAGVPRYIASDYTLDYRNIKLGDLPAKDPMKHVQAYLEKKSSKIKAVHILNGGFTEIYFGDGGVWDPENFKLKCWGNGDDKLEMTTYSNAAEYTAFCALDETATGYMHCMLSSQI